MSEITKKTFTPTELRAWSDREKLEAITVASGVQYAKGTIMGRIASSGLYAPYNKTNTDGTEIAKGVLAQDVDTTATGTNCQYTSTMIVGRAALWLSALNGLDGKALSDLGARYGDYGGNSNIVILP